MKFIKKNNGGFSLVELIVVILILGVATTLTAGSFTRLSGAYARRGADSTEILLAKVKLDAMSKHDCYVEIFYDEEDDRYVANLYRDLNNNNNYELYGSEIIGKGRMTITDANTGKTVTSTDKLRIAFNRRIGSLKTASIGSVNLLDNNTAVRLNFSSGGKIKTVVIYPATGYIEN